MVIYSEIKTILAIWLDYLFPLDWSYSHAKFIQKTKLRREEDFFPLDWSYSHAKFIQKTKLRSEEDWIVNFI